MPITRKYKASKGGKPKHTKKIPIPLHPERKNDKDNHIKKQPHKSATHMRLLLKMIRGR
jgi:hypothetical protein